MNGGYETNYKCFSKVHTVNIKEEGEDRHTPQREAAKRGQMCQDHARKTNRSKDHDAAN